MASSDSNTAAINISPKAASSSQMNHDMTMAGSSVGADAYSPPNGSYSPPTFTYTTAEGTTTETMGGMGGEGMTGTSPGSQRDRRYSDEWGESTSPFLCFIFTFKKLPRITF